MEVGRDHWARRGRPSGLFDGLRSDPRFQGLRRRMNLGP